MKTRHCSAVLCVLLAGLFSGPAHRVVFPLTRGWQDPKTACLVHTLQLPLQAHTEGFPSALIPKEHCAMAPEHFPVSELIDSRCCHAECEDPSAVTVKWVQVDAGSSTNFQTGLNLGTLRELDGCAEACADNDDCFAFSEYEFARGGERCGPVPTASETLSHRILTLSDTPSGGELGLSTRPSPHRIEFFVIVWAHERTGSLKHTAPLT